MIAPLGSCNSDVDSDDEPSDAELLQQPLEMHVLADTLGYEIHYERRRPWALGVKVAIMVVSYLVMLAGVLSALDKYTKLASSSSSWSVLGAEITGNMKTNVWTDVGAPLMDLNDANAYVTNSLASDLFTASATEYSVEQAKELATGVHRLVLQLADGKKLDDGMVTLQTRYSTVLSGVNQVLEPVSNFARMLLKWIDMYTTANSMASMFSMFSPMGSTGTTIDDVAPAPPPALDTCAATTSSSSSAVSSSSTASSSSSSSSSDPFAMVMSVISSSAIMSYLPIVTDYLQKIQKFSPEEFSKDVSSLVQPFDTFHVDVSPVDTSLQQFIAQIPEGETTLSGSAASDFQGYINRLKQVYGQDGPPCSSSLTQLNEELRPLGEYIKVTNFTNILLTNISSGITTGTGETMPMITTYAGVVVIVLAVIAMLQLMMALYLSGRFSVDIDEESRDDDEYFQALCAYHRRVNELDWTLWQQLWRPFQRLWLREKLLFDHHRCTYFWLTLTRILLFLVRLFSVVLLFVQAVAFAAVGLGAVICSDDSQNPLANLNACENGLSQVAGLLGATSDVQGTASFFARSKCSDLGLVLCPHIAELSSGFVVAFLGLLMATIADSSHFTVQEFIHFEIFQPALDSGIARREFKVADQAARSERSPLSSARQAKAG